MPELTDPNPLLQANAAGDTYKPKTTPLGGAHVHHTMPADPADGSAIKAASQADVQAVRDRLPAAGAASAAKQDDGNAALTTLVASMAALVAAAATEATMAAINSKLPTKMTGPPHEDGEGLPTRPINRRNVRCSFTMTGAGLISTKMQQIGPTGPGISVSQSGGNLLIAAGTTPNAEFLARSVSSFSGMRTLLQSTVLSGRIINNTFDVWLADLIGENLPYTINSATSITVTMPGASNPFANYVGSKIEIGAITGAAGIPMSGTVASTAGQDVTLTVAGWPASGTGTCCLWGFNAFKLRYTGTTVTNMTLGARRQGYDATDVTATINTTASPGHITRSELSNESATMIDRLRASSTSAPYSPRGDVPDQLPANEEELYVFVRCLNGTVAPASSTTWTLGFWDVAESAPIEVNLVLSGQLPDQKAMPVRQVGSLTIGTLPALAAGTNSIGGVYGAPSSSAGGFNTFSRTVFTADITTGAPTSVKASAGAVGRATIGNSTATGFWFHVYNKASAPTLGTDTPVGSWWCPAGQSTTCDIAALAERLGTGVAYAMTPANATVPVAGTIAVGSGQISVSTSYV